MVNQAGKICLYIQAQLLRVTQSGRTWIPHLIPHASIAGHENFGEDNKDKVWPLLYF